MPVDKNASDNIPVQAEKIGWRRALQQTDFHRLSADQLRQYEMDAGVAVNPGDDRGDKEVGDPIADFEAYATRYYARRTETTSPERAERRGEAIRIADAASMLIHAINEASDITLDRLDILGGVIGELHQAATKTLTAATQLVGPASAGRPSHEHLDDFIYELVLTIDQHYGLEFRVDFTDDGDPIPAVSVLLWLLVKHFVPDVDEGSLRTAMKRARTDIREGRETDRKTPFIT
ncbi:hypothetical protein SAE02_69120 [Skermanella aerolata]|uniref:Uncharacterized protein n=1 Tax=Skermanella aerolata TaxID=393310 RepID=A0A512E225_9PROT|nr:hypothetical protein [Skermanella aerolata]KJB91513.1 hypothetical protein N826_23995 [Skermanella aerolata KACC 11604]GEO42764.1 hypothetical protein SAE02_69120 [Skermanella aerolata]